MAHNNRSLFNLHICELTGDQLTKAGQSLNGSAPSVPHPLPSTGRLVKHILLIAMTEAQRQNYILCRLRTDTLSLLCSAVKHNITRQRKYTPLMRARRTTNSHSKGYRHSRIRELGPMLQYHSGEKKQTNM